MDNRTGLARSVVLFAALGGMPDTYWHTDSRIAAACDVIGIDPVDARSWAEEVDPHITFEALRSLDS